MGIKRCYVCHAENDSIELHHIIMQAAGGEEGPTVPLCATCHSLVHKQALIFEGKSTNKELLFTPDQWSRAKNIVGYIQLAIRKNKHNPDGNHPAKLYLTITKSELALLHIMKGDAGYTNLNKYMTDLIRGFLRSKFPTRN